MFPKGRGRKDNEKDVKGGRLKMGREKQKVGRKKRERATIMSSASVRSIPFLSFVEPIFS